MIKANKVSYSIERTLTGVKKDISIGWKGVRKELVEAIIGDWRWSYDAWVTTCCILVCIHLLLQLLIFVLDRYFKGSILSMLLTGGGTPPPPLPPRNDFDTPPKVVEVTCIDHRIQGSPSQWPPSVSLYAPFEAPPVPPSLPPTKYKMIAYCQEGEDGHSKLVRVQVKFGKETYLAIIDTLADLSIISRNLLNNTMRNKIEGPPQSAIDISLCSIFTIGKVEDYLRIRETARPEHTRSD
jgi:hypothetical protein